MTSKTKQVVFKNPFDLIEQEEEPMSMPTNTQPRYQPPPNVVHTPLPFNPYQIAKQQKVIPVPQKANEPKTSANTSLRSTNSFVSPFGQQQRQNFVPDPLPSNQNSFEPQKSYAPEREVTLDENGDPPLLYDIGIEPEKIKERIMLILKLSQPSYDIIHDPDLSGPIVIALSLGFLLLLAGKIHFGDIYAMFIVGNGLLYILLNFMSQTQNIPFYNIMSILGYGLLPMLVLGFFGVFLTLNKGLGIVVGLLIAFWASYAASNFMNVLMKDAKDRRLLIMYPMFLYYLSFTFIVIF